MNNRKVLLVLACALLVLLTGLTMLAGHLMVPEGKTSTYWAAIMFLSLAEAALVLGGLPLWGGQSARQGDFGFKAVLWVSLGAYLLASLALLGLKAILGEAFSDGVLAALVIAMLVLMVLVYALFTVREQVAQEAEAPRQELRLEERSLAVSLREAVLAMAGLELEDVELQQARERARKLIETCIQALEHAQGRMPAGTEIAGLASTVLELSRALPASGPGALAERFRGLLNTAGLLRNALSTHGLL